MSEWPRSKFQASAVRQRGNFGYRNRTAAPYTKEVDIVENKQTPEFPAYYTVLCAHVANAIDAMEQQNYGAAKELLITGMQDAEEIILSQKE